MRQYYYSIDTPLGVLCITEQNGEICAIDQTGWGERLNTPLIARAADELNEYFAGVRRTFDLPLNPGGTAFQKLVWEELCRIPYGETRSYGEVAAAVGRPKAARAVGMANHANPIMIVIPCHRVIGADGSLTGYARGLEYKRRLLTLEGGIAINANLV